MNEEGKIVNSSDTLPFSTLNVPRDLNLTPVDVDAINEPLKSRDEFSPKRIPLGLRKNKFADDG